MRHRTIPLLSTAMAALLATALTSPAWAGEDHRPLAFDPANNTKPESQYNDEAPRSRDPSQPEKPTVENGAMDLDGSLSADQPLDGRAPSPYAARSAPGRE